MSRQTVPYCNSKEAEMFVIVSVVDNKISSHQQPNHPNMKRN